MKATQYNTGGHVGNLFAPVTGSTMPTADTAAIWAAITDAVRLKQQGGGYYVAPPEALLSAAEAYYNTHVEAVRDALTAGGADAETVAAVLFDYGAAMCGIFEHRATPQQIQNALTVFETPAAAYDIDKYGLYVLYVHNYARKYFTLEDYTKRVKEQPDAGQRAAFFARPYTVNPDADAGALYWLLKNNYITVEDFAGIEQSAIQRFLTFLNRHGLNTFFYQYVYFAERALNATRGQLRRLTPPPNFRGAVSIALYNAYVFGEYTDELIKEHEQRAAETQAERLTSDSRGELSGTVTVYENCALILGRPLYGSNSGADATQILPISCFVDDYVKKHAIENGITPGLIEKAVEGVNLLQQLKQTKPVGGVYTLHTNLSEFAKLCGYVDAGEQEKQQLFTALKVLHNLYIVLWKTNGRREAKQLFGLNSYELPDNGATRELVLNVFDIVFSGRPQFMEAQKFKELRKAEKGAADRRFRYAIMAASKCNENELLARVFGYDAMRDEAQGDAKRLAKVNTYIRKHKAADRKRLRKMFDNYVKQGILESWEVRPDKKTGAPVYYWKRLKPATAENVQ